MLFKELLTHLKDPLFLFQLVLISIGIYCFVAGGLLIGLALGLN